MRSSITLYFIKRIEYLGRYINFMANVLKSGIGINAAKDGPKIPYFMFAGDCLVFYRANRTAA